MALHDEDMQIERRRAAVGKYLARGFTQREIVDKITEEDIKNPETGSPYTVMTINNDIKAIRAQWAKDAKKSVEKHRARQLAELNEVKREGWKHGNPNLVLTALGHEARLTDTSAPIRINIDLVTSLWDALEKRGRDPEQVLKAMLKRLMD